MGGELETMEKAALRELGRLWERLVWSVLFAIAIIADVWFAVYPSTYPWSEFALGLFTGIAFSGLAITLTRRRSPPARVGAAKTS